MHVAFAVAVVGILRQHGAELFEFALAPQLHHPLIHLMVKFARVAVHPLFGALVVDKAVRQRTAGQHRHGAVVFFNGFEDRFAQPAAVGKVVNGTESGDRYHLEVLIAVHVAHRHQGAVLQLQAGNIVRFGTHPELHRLVGDKLAQLRVAVVVVGHVANKMRQFVTGVDALKMVGTVDVVGAVDQPVGIEHDDGIDAHFTAALANFFMPVDRALTAAVVFPRQLRQIHRRHVSDFCC